MIKFSEFISVIIQIQFELTCAALISAKIKAVRSPFPAAKIAMVNHEDNFVHYFGPMAYDIVIEEFMILDDLKAASDELYDWFNKLPAAAYHIPIINQTLRNLYREYNAR